MPLIDLPFQWSAFDWRLTYDGGMLSVPFVSDGWFEKACSNEGGDVEHFYVRVGGVFTVVVTVISAFVTCWQVSPMASVGIFSH
ncbi:hypothetical protein AB0E82_37830 [Streptomyces anulatus]|uniref:hypothetical protein n=1 Tax=Streptomyces anulatus TaxID=1892 RepID=UPI003406F4D0